MLLNLSGEITAIATAVLAGLAFNTALFAFFAWRGQFAQIKVLGDQLTEQRKINEEQTEVLDLQVTELGESLKEHKREAVEAPMATELGFRYPGA
jgi:hypothetical protein